MYESKEISEDKMLPFFQSKRPGYLSTLSWKKVIPEWQSITAVSLNVGRGICLVKPAKLYNHTQNTIQAEGIYLIQFRTQGLWPG